MSQYPQPPAPGFPPPPPPGPGYAAPQVMPGQQTNGLAIGAFICGLLGCFVLTPLIAIILGVLGLKDAKKKGGSGRGLAIAGIVLAVLWVGVGVLFSGGILALVGASKQERALAASFARNVAANNIDAAMAQVTSSVKQDEVKAAAAKLQPLGTVTDTTMFGVSGQATTAGKFWMIAGAVTFNQGQGVGYAAKVVNENGTPKIDGFVFNVNGGGGPVSGGNSPDPNTAKSGGSTP